MPWTILFSTSNHNIIYTTPFNSVYGAGVGPKALATINIGEFGGNNLLGIVLGAVRNRLFQELEDVAADQAKTEPELEEENEHNDNEDLMGVRDDRKTRVMMVDTMKQ